MEYAVSEVKVDMSASADILGEVLAERVRQIHTWGEQNHPDGTGTPSQKEDADGARVFCQANFAAGDGTWADILTEEFCEALAEGKHANLRAELIQVAAVATAWVEAIDRRRAWDGRE